MGWNVNLKFPLTGMTNKRYKIVEEVLIRFFSVHIAINFENRDVKVFKCMLDVKFLKGNHIRSLYKPVNVAHCFI